MVGVRIRVKFADGVMLVVCKYKSLPIPIRNSNSNRYPNPNPIPAVTLKVKKLKINFEMYIADRKATTCI